MFDIFKMRKLGFFVGGVLFGTAGIKVLSSKDAKRFIQIVQQQCYVPKRV